MYNPYYVPPAPPQRPQDSVFRSPNYNRKSPGGLMRQVTNGVGIGMTLLIVSMLGMSADLYSLPPGFQRLLEDFNTSTIIEGAVYAAAFLLAYFTIKATVAIPGEKALPWAKVDTSLSVFAVCFGLGCSYAGAFFTQILNDAFAGLTGYEATMPDTDMPETALGWVLYLISVAVLPAILEEMLFRGAVLQSLRQFGDRFAVIASSFIFALGHGNLIQGPNTFVMGMVLACLVIYTGSMKIGILLHFSNNFFFSLIGAADEIAGGLPDVFYGIFVAVIVVLGIFGIVMIRQRYPGVFSPGRGDYPLGGFKKALHLCTTPMMLFYIFICVITIVLYFAPAASAGSI